MEHLRKNLIMNRTNNNKLPKVIYNADSKMRTPGKLLCTMFQDLINSKELSWRFFIRDVSAQYRQSLLGFFWAFLPPIITGIIFIILQSKNVVNFGSTDIPYPVFVLTGTILWQVFVESLNAPLKSVILARPMLAKINFPYEALIVSGFYQTVFNLSIKLIVLAGIFIYFEVPFTSSIFYALLTMLMLILLGLSIGLLLTPIGALYSDIQSGLLVITQFWFFITPVVYPAPESYPYSLVAYLNPVSPLIIASRELLTKGTVSNINSLVITSCLIVVLLLSAWLIYRVALPIIIERMSA